MKPPAIAVFVPLSLVNVVVNTARESLSAHTPLPACLPPMIIVGGSEEGKYTSNVARHHPLTNSCGREVENEIVSGDHKMLISFSSVRHSLIPECTESLWIYEHSNAGGAGVRFCYFVGWVNFSGNYQGFHSKNFSQSSLIDKTTSTRMYSV